MISEGDTASEGTTVVLAEQVGKIFADLRTGVDVNAAVALHSNDGLCSPGVKLHGAGFILSLEEASSLGINRVQGLQQHIRPYLNGRDLTGTSRNKLVIDLFGLSITEVQRRFPEVYQWINDRVKPERDHNRRATYSRNWWIFGEPRADFRPALLGLSRYVATVETAKHRIFVFLEVSTLPDNMLVNIASADAFHLGVLSSNIHVMWALAAGGTLEDRPRYNKTRCFDPFPFPDCSEAQKQTVRDVAERLDAHRKRQQQLHPWLTLTEMYNVFEKLRATEELTEEDHSVYNAALVGILRELHQELDHAVCSAYGWSPDLTPVQTLEHVVALNVARRTEEASGHIRWLRPEYQAPNEVAVPRTLEGFAEEASSNAVQRRQPWPSAIPEQFRVVKEVMRSVPPLSPQQIAANFRPAPRTRIAEILETLTALGQVRESAGRYSM